MTIAQLDHIVILLPYAYIVTPPAWITDKFTISPGGRHGDNKTENKLVVFADGSYLELIAFIDDDPKHREGHWWGNKGWGIIDFAFTLKKGPSEFPIIQAELNSLDIPDEWKPQDLRGGSRFKPDGETIEWQVAFPDGSARGKAPFWCFDVTPREKRVTSDPHLITHPSGAKGVGAILISLDEEDVAGVGKMFHALLPSVEVPPGGENGRQSWTLGSVKDISGFTKPQVSIAEIFPTGSHVGRGRQLMARLNIFTNGDANWEIKEDVGGELLWISSP